MKTANDLRLIAAMSGLVLALSADAVEAQETTESESEIVVSATLNDPAATQGDSSKTLETHELAAFAPVSVLDNFSLLPGVVAFEKGGAGGGSYVSIRGGEPNFALVVINGVRVDDPLNSSGGGFDFSQLDPALVSQLDLISGPQSTTYGADALSGVISLKMGGGATGSDVRAHGGMGTGGRYEVGGAFDLNGNAGNLTGAFGHSDTGDLIEGNTNTRYSAMIAASPNIGDGFALDLFGLFADGRSEGFPEDSGGPRLAASSALETHERQQVALGGTFAAQLSPNVTAQVRSGFSRSDFEAVSPGIAPGVIDGIPPISTDSVFKRYELVGSLTWQVNPWLSLESGATITEEVGRSVGDIDFGAIIPTEFSISRGMPGVFATATANAPGGISASAGLRVDWPEGGKERWTPRIGASVPIAQTGASFVANFAKGFKRPSLFALGYPLIANPNLEDERSETFDVGVLFDQGRSGWAGSIVFFRSTYRNLIDFEPVLFTNVNRNRVSVEGAEIAVSKTIGKITGRGALTHLSAKSDDGAALRYRPKWTGRIALLWQLNDAFAVGLDAEFSGSFNDSSVPTGLVRNSGFATFAFQAEWAISEHVELFGTIRNITDTDYERSVGFPETGRNVFVGIRSAL